MERILKPVKESEVTIITSLAQKEKSNSKFKLSYRCLEMRKISLLNIFTSLISPQKWARKALKLAIEGTKSHLIRLFKEYFIRLHQYVP